MCKCEYLIFFQKFIDKIYLQNFTKFHETIIKKRER